MMSARPIRCILLASLFASLSFPPLLAAHTPDPLRAAARAPAPGAPAESLTGTVHELVVDDRVAGVTARYLALVTPTGETLTLSGNAADTLHAGTVAQVVGRRNGDRLFLDSARILGSKAAAAPPGTPQSVEGTLAVAHADDFVTGRSEYLYEVHDAAWNATRLKLHGRPEALQAGMRVAAHGSADAASGELEPTRIEVLALPDATTEPTPAASTTTTTSTSTTTTTGVVAKSTTAHSVLVVPLEFSNTTTAPMAISSLQSVMTTASNSVANFFREVSYGQHTLSVTMPANWLRATIAAPSSCSYTSIASAGDAAATAAGYTLSNYQFRVYVFPYLSVCGWSGLAYIGSPKQAFINGGSSAITQVIAHEMGHNFGLLHAASLDCGASVTGGTCTASEYGDPWDTMGNQRVMHYNAAQKALLGWIPSTSVKTHSSGTATYTLSPLETGGASTYAVKIPAASNRTYWIEYRQPIGFDAPLASYPNNGAQFRVASPFETLCGGCGSYSDDTEFLDMTPATSAFTDGALLAGQSFTDTNYGITVSVISATASALTVQVSGPGSTKTATTTALVSSANPSMAGSSVTFTATVTGTSPTGSVAFTDNGTTISGCGAVGLAGSGNARTAACPTAPLTAGSHSIVAKYAGDATNNASSSATLTQTVNSSTTTTTETNVALASTGATALASTAYSANYPASATINNERAGTGWGSGTGGWNDATYNAWPDWLQVSFAATKTIDRVVVYSVQDNYTSPVEPTDTMTFTKYGIQDFQVQGWNGSAWTTLASVTGNNLVKRTLTFPAFTTSRIRIVVTKSLAVYSRITEVEAWGK